MLKLFIRWCFAVCLELYWRSWKRCHFFVPPWAAAEGWVWKTKTSDFRVADSSGTRRPRAAILVHRPFSSRAFTAQSPQLNFTRYASINYGYHSSIAILCVNFCSLLHTWKKNQKVTRASTH